MTLIFELMKQGVLHSIVIDLDLVFWPGGLELTPGFYPGSNEQHRLFYASTQNVLVRALLVHPAH